VGVCPVIRLRVYQVTADGERTAGSKPVTYEPTVDDRLPGTFDLPPCECPRCRAQTERAAS